MEGDGFPERARDNVRSGGCCMTSDSTRQIDKRRPKFPCRTMSSRSTSSALSPITRSSMSSMERLNTTVSRRRRKDPDKLTMSLALSTLSSSSPLSSSSSSSRTICSSSSSSSCASVLSLSSSSPVCSPSSSLSSSTCICRFGGLVFRLDMVLVFLTIAMLLQSCQIGACGPGRRPGPSGGPRKRTPLVFKQHIPNVSEKTLGASGVSEGKITRESDRFKDLTVSDNENIIFKDEEGTNADRIMSQRCRGKLDVLEVAVMNQWPGVLLRVTEAWDEDDHHAKDSLHYEGRAVDITTSDRDRTKYGMLARLAVESGFDWVYYESRGHIHCSVKSDSSAALNKVRGCFPGEANVLSETEGWKSLADVRVGERLMSMRDDGAMQYSDVILFLERDPNSIAAFYKIHTADKQVITLTSKHLIYAISSSNNSTKDFSLSNMRLIDAESVSEGDHILVVDSTIGPKLSRVVHKDTTFQRGIFAPLTSHGTILVDDVVVSCYAQIYDVTLAQAVFAPVRLLHKLGSFLPHDVWRYLLPSEQTNGVHWYADILYSIGKQFLSADILFVP